MLNLQDLTISELQAYCDGLTDAIEIMETEKPVTDFTAINDRYFEAQRIIDSRFVNCVMERIVSHKNYEVKH